MTPILAVVTEPLGWWDVIKVLAGCSVLNWAVGGAVVYLAKRFARPIDSISDAMGKALGENAVINKIVDNTERTTHAQEQIKASLSHAAWDRQQRWTQKIEAYTELASALADYSRAHSRLTAVALVAKNEPGPAALPDALSLLRHQRRAMQRYNEGRDKFEQAVEKVQIVGEQEPTMAAIHLLLLANQVNIVDPTSPEARKQFGKARSRFFPPFVRILAIRIWIGSPFPN